ncbi:hypothetical protein N7532_011467 [Penicillium argentinense]|uniref:BZIP transcription factor n=1 Tax=Penicillium argentinense TaxID=1131581 RepID=A0A9W9JUJ3_9EURO|nr:uncharacterized protein N7532_011467 [Penicillium argentinense]KAJ5082424.1 hypothetical protein N7532_011467 [Penicillium argentinense]
MASRAPGDSDYAPSPAIESAIEGHSQQPIFAKSEDSPVPSRSVSLDAESLIPDNNDNNGTTTAGRKRKLNSTSSRGVANLTPDQLAKKRANDRQAQRAIRERTKTHIEALEQQVRDLASQKPVLDLQAAMQHNERIRSENRELRQSFKAVMDIIQPLLARPESTGNLVTQYSTLEEARLTGVDLPAVVCQPRSVPPQTTSSPFPDTDHLTPNPQSALPGDKSYEGSVASLDTPSPTHSAPTLGSRRNSANGGTQSTSFRSALDNQRHNTAHGLDLGLEERLGFNFLLDPSQNIPKVDRLRRSNSENFRSSQPNLQSPLYLQPLNHPAEQGPPAFATPIRNTGPTCTLDSILLDFLHNRQREAAQGIPRQKLVGPPYPSVSSLLNPEKSVYSHPVSKVFTDILRTFPDISSLPEQVAVLYTMFLLMRWQIYPTQENYDRLPEWLTPRPTQLLSPHPAWMDYVPWPRMRDRLATSHQDYPFENWFIPFTRGLSVNWPYEATDCLLSAGDSEELLINPVFERHMRNLTNWSLGPMFAEAYPNLVDTTQIRPEVKQGKAAL